MSTNPELLDKVAAVGQKYKKASKKFDTVKEALTLTKTIVWAQAAADTDK